MTPLRGLHSSDDSIDTVEMPFDVHAKKGRSKSCSVVLSDRTNVRRRRHYLQKDVNPTLLQIVSNVDSIETLSLNRIHMPGSSASPGKSPPQPFLLVSD